MSDSVITHLTLDEVAFIQLARVHGDLFVVTFRGAEDEVISAFAAPGNLMDGAISLLKEKFVGQFDLLGTRVSIALSGELAQDLWEAWICFPGRMSCGRDTYEYTFPVLFKEVRHE